MTLETFISAGQGKVTGPRTSHRAGREWRGTAFQQFEAFYEAPRKQGYTPLHAHDGTNTQASTLITIKFTLFIPYLYLLGGVGDMRRQIINTSCATVSHGYDIWITGYLAPDNKLTWTILHLTFQSHIMIKSQMWQAWKYKLRSNTNTLDKRKSWASHSPVVVWLATLEEKCDAQLSCGRATLKHITSLINW